MKTNKITAEQVRNVCRHHKLGRWTKAFTMMVWEGKVTNDYFMWFVRHDPKGMACLKSLQAVLSAPYVLRGWWGPAAVENAKRVLAIAG